MKDIFLSYDDLSISERAKIQTFTCPQNEYSSNGENFFSAF